MESEILGLRTKKMARKELLQQEKGMTFKVYERKEIVIHQRLLLFTYYTMTRFIHATNQR